MNHPTRLALSPPLDYATHLRSEYVFHTLRKGVTMDLHSHYANDPNEVTMWLYLEPRWATTSAPRPSWSPGSARANSNLR